MSYTAEYNRKSSMRGDTLLGFSVDVMLDAAPASIASARMHLRSSGGRLIYAYPVGFSGGTVTIPDVAGTETAHWPIGTLLWDIEITTVSGRIATWLKGTQPILADRTF